MSLLTFDQIVEAIDALPPQDRIRLRQWLNRNAANEAPNQGGASNGGARNAPDVDVIPPIVMKRVPPIAPERGKANRSDGEALWSLMSPLRSWVTAQPGVRILELLEQVAGHRLDLRAQFQLGQPFFRDRPDA